MIAGITTGMVSQFIQYPLDTIKVRFQMGQSNNMTLRGTIVSIYTLEGLRGFYKGVLSPLASRIPISTSLYFSQGWTVRYIEQCDRQFSRT